MTKPIIGIVANHKVGDCSRKKEYRLLDNVVDYVEAAGGLAFILPYELEAIPQVLSTVDGLLLPGGDICYGHEYYDPGHKSRFPASKRAAYEIALLNLAMVQDKPTLGLCLGMQIMGCMLGARLHVLPKKWGFLKSIHRNEDGSKLVHPVSIKKDSKLAALVNMQQLEVNSIHAEALSKMDEKFVSARSPDGVIEAIEHPDKTFMLGVQWHPEYFLDANSKHLSICRGLVEAALAKQS